MLWLTITGSPISIPTIILSILNGIPPQVRIFLLSFNVKDDDDFLSQLFDAYMNFDTEQHAIENYGMRGAPGLRVLLDDAEAIEGEIQRLWCELSKVKETA